MTRQMTITEVKAKLLALIDEVEKGEEIEITRHGRTVARISPARGPQSIRGMFAGVARTATDNLEELYSTGVTWDVQRDDAPA
jgi:prevent-host-death family protein